MKPRLYLASASSYRAALLARLGVEFATEVPGIDEAPVPGETPREQALRLARAKAAAVSARVPEAWVLGSDQVAVCAGRIHEKPGDALRCREQLRASSGQTVEFHTAVVLQRRRPQAIHEHVDFTLVHFRALAENEIARYVAIDRPFDCAGGFRSEGLGATLLQSIETRDPASLIGLPLIWVAQALREAGLDPLARAQP
ncbi:MAG TPA: Maf family nucleotide pyrophosphatase [Steroidobacteraceae bacterium]